MKRAILIILSLLIFQLPSNCANKKMIPAAGSSSAPDALPNIFIYSIPDEVLIGGQPILTEDEVLSMTRQYISKLKSEHEDNEKIQKKLDKYLDNFDVKKFMKKNPNMTSPDFYMIMFNETEGLVK